MALLHANDSFFNKEFLMLNYFKDHINIIKDYIYPDWVCMCPRITYFIGKYYLYLNDKKEAESWFTLGSNLDYEGRQSSLPFNEISRNQYEILLLKLEAKEYSSCREILHAEPLSCLRPLPIESKLIPNYIDQNNEEEVEDYKFECYSNFNPSFKEDYVYLGFQYLDKDQKKEFEEILNKRISKTTDKKEIKKLESLRHRLTDANWVYRFFSIQ